MMITKNLMHKLFIAAFIMITLIGSHQLNAMEQQSVKASEKISLDADFQAYLLLSAIDNNHQYYLFPELVQIIAASISKFIDKECYEKYGACLKEPFSLLRFIDNRYNNTMSNISIANIVKRCLKYSGKSLSEIKFPGERTVFHQIAFQSNHEHFNTFAPVALCINILRFVAGSETWDVICIQDIYKRTPLHYFGPYFNKYELAALLSAAPNRQKAWDLILTPDIDGNTILAMAKKYAPRKAVQRLKKYRPEKIKTNKPNLKSYIHDHYKKFNA
ncbi:MAG TPA: hypothetical protein VJ201_05585 [Candidatus Babeliales bacterium]|nr:hypothetical protein [Candidatus Babeliales bacterium]